MPETFRHRGKQQKKNISNVLEMSEMDNAKGIFQKSSADKKDEHEFKIFQSYALKYKNCENYGPLYYSRLLHVLQKHLQWAPSWLEDV